MLSYRSGWHAMHYNKTWDALIIGSGITGLSAAINLKQMHPHLQVLVVDQHLWGASATTQNAGFLCLGSPGELLFDLRNFGEHAVLKNLSLRWRGAKRLLKTLGAKKTGYKQTGGFEVFTSAQSNHYDDVCQNLNQLNIIMKRVTDIQNFYSVVDTKKLPLPANHQFKTGFHIQFEGQLNPALLWENLKLKALNLNVAFQTGIRCSEITSGIECFVITNNGPNPFIKTKKVLLATNSETDLLTGTKLITPGRGQIILTKPISGLPLKANIHAEEGYLYFRNIGERLLIGGGRHWDFEGENTSQIAPNEFILTKLKQYTETYIVGKPITIDQQWSGIMGFTKDKKPVITEHQPGWVIAAGLNGMGMAMGAEIGRLAAERLIGKKNKSEKTL